MFYQMIMSKFLPYDYRHIFTKSSYSATPEIVHNQEVQNCTYLKVVDLTDL